MMSRQGVHAMTSKPTRPWWPSPPGWSALFLVLAWVGAGCQSTQPSGTAGTETKRKPDPVLVRGLDASVGRVESIRGELRLVVLDYSLSTLPQLGDMLAVSREGTEVGIIKVTGPFRAGTGKLGGEIVSGDIQVGDIVRTQTR